MEFSHTYCSYDTKSIIKETSFNNLKTKLILPGAEFGLLFIEMIFDKKCVGGWCTTRKVWFWHYVEIDWIW